MTTKIDLLNQSKLSNLGDVNRVLKSLGASTNEVRAKSCQLVNKRLVERFSLFNEVLDTNQIDDDRYLENLGKQVIERLKPQQTQSQSNPNLEDQQKQAAALILQKNQQLQRAQEVAILQQTNASAIQLAKRARTAKAIQLAAAFTSSEVSDDPTVKWSEDLAMSVIGGGGFVEDDHALGIALENVVSTETTESFFLQDSAPKLKYLTDGSQI